MNVPPHFTVPSSVYWDKNTSMACGRIKLNSIYKVLARATIKNI